MHVELPIIKIDYFEGKTFKSLHNKLHGRDVISFNFVVVVVVGFILISFTFFVRSFLSMALPAV